MPLEIIDSQKLLPASSSNGHLPRDDADTTREWLGLAVLANMILRMVKTLDQGLGASRPQARIPSRPTTTSSFRDRLQKREIPSQHPGKGGMKKTYLCQQHTGQQGLDKLVWNLPLFRQLFATQQRIDGLDDALIFDGTDVAYSCTRRGMRGGDGGTSPARAARALEHDAFIARHTCDAHVQWDCWFVDGGW